MEKNKDLEISLLDAPVGAVVDLVSWGSLSQEDIRKLTDVGIYLDLPLTVSSVTISGPVVVADQQRARRHRTSRCKGAQSSLEQRGR